MIARSFLIIAVLIAAPLVADAEQPEETVTLEVENMLCVSCRANIFKTLKKTEGVRRYDADLAARTVTVTYDPAVTTPEKIAEAIRKLGYDVKAPGPKKVSESPVFAGVCHISPVSAFDD